jgi:hypothetical protein
MFYSEERLVLFGTRYRDARSSYRRTKNETTAKIMSNPAITSIIMYGDSGLELDVSDVLVAILDIYGLPSYLSIANEIKVLGRILY